MKSQEENTARDNNNYPYAVHLRYRLHQHPSRISPIHRDVIASQVKEEKFICRVTGEERKIINGEKHIRIRRVSSEQKRFIRVSIKCHLEGGRLFCLFSICLLFPGDELSKNTR